MARTAVTPAQGTRNAGTAPTSTIINAALVTAGATIAGADLAKLVIRVANSAASALAVTIAAGDSVIPAHLKGQGGLAVTVAASGVTELTALDSARFIQGDGSLSIDFAAGFTGTLETMYRP